MQNSPGISIFAVAALAASAFAGDPVALKPGRIHAGDRASRQFAAWQRREEERRRRLVAGELSATECLRIVFAELKRERRGRQLRAVIAAGGALAL